MSKTYCLSLVLLAALLLNLAPEAKAASPPPPPPPPPPSPCGHAQIQVSQGTESMVGIPRYSVMIVNLCSDCWIAQLHLHCGMFASANVVDPQLFKRTSDGDCLVNGGRPIDSGKVIQFEYSNTFPYPLSVGDYVCGRY